MIDPAWTCAVCGKTYGARPIACECGSLFNGDDNTATLVQTSVNSGAIRMHVVTAGTEVIGITESGAPSVLDEVERIQTELGELTERVSGLNSKRVLTRAYEALDLLPLAVAHDGYQEAVSKHQHLEAIGAPEAEVAASHAALMAQLARLPERY